MTHHHEPIRAPSKRPRPSGKATQSLQDKLLVGGLLLFLGGIVAYVVLGAKPGPATPPPVNHADLVTDIASFQSVVAVGEEGWIAELPAGPPLPAERVQAVCEATWLRLGGGPGQTLTLLGGDGEPVLECGSGTANPVGPRVKLP